MKLLRDNARNRTASPPKAKAEESGEATLYLYDVIVSDDYWGGVAAEAFVKELNATAAPTIHLRINSPGGEVFAARAIEAAIRNHPARIVAHVDGYAASAASFVAVACDEVEIAPGGFFMIHKAWTFTAGNADDLLHTAEMLEKLDASLVDTYAKKTRAGKDILTAHPNYQGSLGTAISEAIELAQTTPNCKYTLGSVLSHVALHQTDNRLMQCDMA